MNAKRKAIWVGGLITAEQPATAPAAVKRATP